jgi:hypothetical protein
MEGYYTYHEGGLPPAQWRIYPVCVPVVGDLRVPLALPVGCSMNVAVSQTWDDKQATEATGVLAVPGGTARLTNGLWAYRTERAEGLICPDGSRVKATDFVEFDSTSLAGTRTTTWGDDCGGRPGLSKAQFTLTFAAPFDPPVDRYPLICEPGGLRRCS